MCHQSVGLVQGAVEAAGMSTISFSVRPEITVNMLVPRAVYVRFPTGNPVGQPHMPNQQRAILRGALAALEAIREPGTVLEMPFRWRRMPDEDPGAPTAVAPPARPAVAASGAYADAKALVSAVETAYVKLVREVDRYREWLEAAVAAERARPKPDPARLQALVPQLRYLAELQAALEGPTHDGLVRVADRVVRIRHWEEGVFL